MPVKLNPLFLFTAAFLVLAPLSVAGNSPMEDAAKYLRLGTTILIVGLGCICYRCFRLRPIGSALIWFVAFYVLAGVWSDLPHWALLYKGMFGLTCLSGLALAYSLQTSRELVKGLRFLGLVAGFAGAFAFLAYLRNPGESLTNGRLSVMAINANTIGGTAAPLLILCAHLALNERSRGWRWVAYASCGLLAIAIVGSASRGALVTVAAGCLLLALPFAKRPGTLIGAAVLVVMLGAVVLEFIPIPGLERLSDGLLKDTRSGIWRFALRRSAQAPVLGEGWLHWGTSWGTVQSAYLQVLVETGIVGVLILGRFLLVLALRTSATFRMLSRIRASKSVAWLAVAFTGSVLLHGLCESSVFVGTALNALLLGFGVGLMDRAPEFAIVAQRSAAVAARRQAKHGMPRPRVVVAVPG